MRIQRWVQAATLAAAAVGPAGAAGGGGVSVGAAGDAVDMLPTFKAVYAATWNGIKLGEITLELEREGTYCYRYQSHARPRAMVRMFYGEPAETSHFCLVDGAVKPVRFRFDHGDDSYELDFDTVDSVVRGAGETRELPDNAQDRFGMHQAVRAWIMRQAPEPPAGDFTFSMVEDDRIAEYTLRVTGEESVKVPAGSYDAFLLERIDPRRIGRFWVAPGADYMPVKVENGKDGDVQLTMELLRYTPKDDAPEASAGES